MNFSNRKQATNLQQSVGYFQQVYFPDMSAQLCHCIEGSTEDKSSNTDSKEHGAIILIVAMQIWKSSNLTGTLLSIPYCSAIRRMSSGRKYEHISETELKFEACLNSRSIYACASIKTI